MLLTPFTAGFSWFERELQADSSSPLVNLVLHTTRSVRLDGVSVDNEEKVSAFPLRGTITSTRISSEQTLTPKPEKYPLPFQMGVAVPSGRPNVMSIVKEVDQSAGQHEKIIVATCGPASLIKDTRKAISANISPSGPYVALHCEHFGW